MRDAGDVTSCSNSDVGPRSGGCVRRFSLAAQPEIMRAAEKDDQYASFVHDACRDAFCHLFVSMIRYGSFNSLLAIHSMLILLYCVENCFYLPSGTRVAVAYQNENKLLGQVLYYLLTTGAGKQTLGEEYYDITQVSMLLMMLSGQKNLMVEQDGLVGQTRGPCSVYVSALSNFKRYFTYVSVG